MCTALVNLNTIWTFCHINIPPQYISIPLLVDIWIFKNIVAFTHTKILLEHQCISLLMHKYKNVYRYMHLTAKVVSYIHFSNLPGSIISFSKVLIITLISSFWWCLVSCIFANIDIISSSQIVWIWSIKISITCDIEYIFMCVLCTQHSLTHLYTEQNIPLEKCLHPTFLCLSSHFYYPFTQFAFIINNDGSIQGRNLSWWEDD